MAGISARSRRENRQLAAAGELRQPVLDHRDPAGRVGPVELAQQLRQAKRTGLTVRSESLSSRMTNSRSMTNTRRHLPEQDLAETPFSSCHRKDHGDMGDEVSGGAVSLNRRKIHGPKPPLWCGVRPLLGTVQRLKPATCSCRPTNPHVRRHSRQCTCSRRHTRPRSQAEAVPGPKGLRLAWRREA
jgi:hypothetical protein